MKEAPSKDEQLIAAVTPLSAPAGAALAMHAKMEKEISSRDARIAALEHALRFASEKFHWLASFHLNSAFSKQEARQIGEKLWKVQSGELSSLLGEVKI